MDAPGSLLQGVSADHTGVACYKDCQCRHSCPKFAKFALNSDRRTRSEAGARMTAMVLQPGRSEGRQRCVSEPPHTQEGRGVGGEGV